MFRLGASMVDAIVAGVPIEPLARYFEYWLLRLQGVYGTGARLSSGAQSFLRSAQELSPIRIGRVTVSARTLEELESVHRELIAMHLEKDLKSARVLKEMQR
jgi:hypothetical protein